MNIKNTMDIKNGMNTYKNMTFNINTMNTNNKRKHPKKMSKHREINKHT
jgi:hypothetical protein